MILKHNVSDIFLYKFQARAVMNENHSAATRLMYQLFIALGKKSVSTLVDTCSCGTPRVAKNLLTCSEHTDVLQAQVSTEDFALLS